MTYVNNFCADVGTANCPCPLAETGDCLICGRLAGKDHCDCRWAGVCVYNEYIQNGRVVRNRRKNEAVPILKKIWYGSDLLVLVLEVTKGFALKAAQPGSFVFLNVKEKSEFCNVPVSVMKADAEKGRIYLALKIISGKTKNIADEETDLIIRGVYRNGLLGQGTVGLAEDAGIKKSVGGKENSEIKKPAGSREDTETKSDPGQNFLHKEDLKKWLVLTKGVGFAPAVNLLRWADDKVDVDLLVDTEKVSREIVRDYLQGGIGESFENINIRNVSLSQLTDAMSGEGAKQRPALLAGKYSQADYDRVIILTSDYYIKTLAEKMDIPAHKLVFSNNFRMCCGEGICGACGHIDAQGNVSKMCKCKELDIMELY